MHKKLKPGLVALEMEQAPFCSSQGLHGAHTDTSLAAIILMKLLSQLPLWFFISICVRLIDENFSYSLLATSGWAS